MQEGLAEIPVPQIPYKMSPERIAEYVQWEQSRGVSAKTIRCCKRVTASLYEWLPEDKIITKERLRAWREALREKGYSPNTELHYVKGINRYLDYAGCAAFRFNRGRAKDIAGKQFGYLTAIEPTGQKERKDYIWRCQCKCGKIAEFPATRLLTGNTLSCGCLRGAHLKDFNQYYEGTSIRMSMTEHIHSVRAESGYTGVTKKRDKWKAYIRYKGRYYSLGCYTDLEDAVKARARGKELVRMDAMGLLDFYEELHKNDPQRPNRDQIRQMLPGEPSGQVQTGSHSRAIRSDNSSGYPGVTRKRNRWSAKITNQKVTYHLGTFVDIEDAIAARREAECLLNADPRQFREKYSKQKEHEF